jgi:Zn-dependent protease
MAFHEAMHAFTSHWLGDTTAQDMGRLTLNPLKHIDLFTTVLLPVILIASGLPPIFAARPVPFNPARVKYDEYGAALIGVAGPLTNLLLAITGAGLFRLLSPEGLLATIIYVFVVINLSFFVFNMLPIPPLDGSRLLYAFAPAPLQELMFAIERMGFMMLIFILFLLLPIIGPIISFAVTGLLQLLLGI